MASPHVLTITDANFQTEVLQSTQPVLIDFWAPWCGPCIQLAPIIDEIATARAGAVKVGKVNVDENQQIAAQFRINSIPALLFFKGGKVAAQLVGRVPKADILAKLDAL